MIRIRLNLLALIAAVSVAALWGPERACADAQDRWAALATPVFRTYSQDDGLPHPVAQAITEDTDGFIWVGTQEGLARWDGYHFRAYKPLAGDPCALPDSLIVTLHLDPRGRLWVGTSAGGLAVYDRERECFKSYGGGPGGLSNLNVKALADDGAGGLWVGTNGGLDHLDPASGRVTSLHHQSGDSSSLPDDHIFALLRDHSGVLWVGTSGGLVRSTDVGARFTAVALGGAPSQPVGVGSLFEDSEGRVWIGTLNDGAFVVAANRGENAMPLPVIATGSSAAALRGQRVFTIAQAARDEIWLGTYSRGIVVVNVQTGQTHPVTHNALVRQSLPDESVWALHVDRAGAMWVATNAGLSRLTSPASGAALTLFSAPSSAHALTAPNLLALAVASDGNVWAGLTAKGIDIIDPLRGRVMNVPPDPSKPTLALPASNVSAFTEMPNGTMYVGTTRGLYRTDLTGGRTTHLMVPGRDPLAAIRGLFFADGRLWIAGYDDGIWSMVPEGGLGAMVEHFDAAQITDRRGTVFAKGLAGDLWIGTRNGLNRLDLATRQIERILPDRTNPAALPVGFVAGLVLDHAGRLWVGTMGGGIAVLTGREQGRPVFRRIDTAQGLPDDNIDSLVLDNGGRIWAATDNGIAVIDPKDFSIHALHRADGVEISSYWDSSAAVTASGELVFGGVGGLTVIRPERFQPWAYRPKIVLTDAQTGGKPVNVDRSEPRGIARQLLVQPDANRLTVEFSALDYSAPELNRYAYWLEGFDRGWVEAPASRRLVAYMNLPPGKFTLHLRGSNRSGAWTETALDIPIRVLPAWFQTLTFKFALACVALVSVWVMVQSRTLYLRRRQRELELLVSARTSELTERTAELEQSKMRIEQIAYQDMLTGLPNRRLFTDDLRSLTALVERQGNDFALLMIDLDRFKQINDTLGHDAGDALLVEAAIRMREALRVSDRLARLGGDEFAVLITDLSDSVPMAQDAVDSVCRRLIDCFSYPIAFKGEEMKTSASIGAAMCPACGNTPEALYKAADLALYEAKRAGRQTWRWHSRTMSVSAPASLLHDMNAGTAGIARV
jgi:diguanylate cyclase (GGDEF)-like protein